MEKFIGKVMHYYDRVGVIVVELEDKIKVGDRIRIVRSGFDFEQTVDSLQIDHQNVEQAEVGSEAAVKVNESTRSGAKVYKIAE